MTKKTRNPKDIGDWFGEQIAPGESRDVTLPIGESYSSMTVRIPLHIRRAEKPGPVLFVSAALHGDEINGTGAVRELIQDPDLQLLKGSVIFVPVLNLLGFDRHDRYLPDRRDLNRSFPGTLKGSLASRMAKVIFTEIIGRSDYGIDLHTAAVRRTNYPNVRGHLSHAPTRKLAELFGGEIVVNGQGPVGSLRREARKAGCPTIIMEGGEVWKVEPGVVKAATRGVKNVLKGLGMLEGERETYSFQLIIEKSQWIRSDRGGFMLFHVSPGDLVEKGQPIFTNTTLLGKELNTTYAPFDGIVIGMSSIPTVSPGEAVCHLGKLPDGEKPAALEARRSKKASLGQQVSRELGANILVYEPSDEAVADGPGR